MAKDKELLKTDIDWLEPLLARSGKPWVLVIMLASNTDKNIELLTDVLQCKLSLTSNLSWT